MNCTRQYRSCSQPYIKPNSSRADEQKRRRSAVSGRDVGVLRTHVGASVKLGDHALSPMDKSMRTREGLVLV